MKANELKIGNYVLDNLGGILKIKAISNESNLFHINGIPITEDWLLKFGFEVYEFDHKSSQYRYKDRLIVIRDGFFVDYGSGVKIKYVHQLQNLIYALTGEELT
jgi:hypothetical protein